ncbi:SAM-dependent methyltransferase [Nakamurella sp. UYEF19]|uniref:class I SAM-dependent methyltransferase n=1 Tax=Nakamurella sp. UYEF19 TaxID=1756392 RepID=UPI00339AADF3
MDEDSYRDEQLVELYDSDNATRDDHEYYLTLANTVRATKILDFGCGTGLLTRALATPGRVVIGVDPSATMLGYARRQPGAEAITWIDGDATAIEGAGDVDLVVSSGNTMMHLSPESYPSVLRSLAGALRPGGGISFESRNPAARAWAHWNRSETYTEREIPSGHLREWLEVTEADGGRVVFDAHNVFQDGRESIYTSVLFFRTAEAITADLERAGFGDIQVRGGWRGEPVSDQSPALVFQARKPWTLT